MDHKSQKNLRLVILDNPVASWESSITQDLFKKLVHLKRQGYGAEYPESVLPLDATDFIGTHIIICDEHRTGMLFPLVAYKSVTLERCEYYRIPFAPLSILKSSGQDDTELQKIIARCKKKNIPLSYDNAWTMLPALREDKEFTKQLRDITTTLGVYYHRDFKIPEWLVMGIKRFKTDQYFRWMGHKDITPEFKFFTSQGEPAHMLHLEKYSKEAIAIAKQHEELWKLRHIVDENTLKKLKLKIAA